MANNITLAEQYLPLLDEIYKSESKTALLDAVGKRIKFVGGNTVQVYTTSMQGLGDYSRTAGFADGDAVGAWETYALSQDRGRSFSIDSMDDEETLGMAFGTLAGEFLRTQVIPEIDAYRFAKYASTSGVLGASADIVSGTTDVAALLDAAEKDLNENEVPTEGRVIFISETAYAALKGSVTRYLANENGVNKEVLTYNGMPVIRVPQVRFNSAITLYDGGASEAAGGYIVPAGSYALNFIMAHPSAIAQVVKHVVPRIFSPEINQSADAWKFDYRVYHDAFVLDNKVTGIYVHKAATANT